MKQSGFKVLYIIQQTIKNDKWYNDNDTAIILTS